MESKPAPLFPVTATQPVAPGGKGCLFPAAVEALEGVGDNATEEPDWLENKSFLPTAALLAEEERKSRLAAPPESPHSEEVKPEEFWHHQTGKTFVEEVPGLQPEFAFRVDRKAEKSLWNYDSIYKSHIARYFRCSDSCLGNPEISLRMTNPKHKDAVERYYTKDKRKVVRARGQTIRPDKDADDRSCQYLSIKDKEVKEEYATGLSDTANPLGILDQATNLYSQGLGLPMKETDGDRTGLNEEMFEKVAFYNKSLHDNPSNVKLWLEFVSFQDVVFQDAKFSSQSYANQRLRDSFQPPRACIEKKIAILEKALEANPSSLELKIIKLEIQQDVVDSGALAKEWDKLLFVHSGDVRLWRHYLMFQQSRLSTFTVSRTIKLYHRCFKTLSPILEGKVKVVKVTDNLEEEMIGVFTQYCDFLHHCGFTEKAVASYQALIEFNLFRPPTLNLVPTQDCVAVFESFWDSSVARFGECGARGWAAWVEGSKGGCLTVERINQVSTEEEQEEILTQDAAVWQKWLRIEHLREHAHWLPWRPDPSKGETEEDCEDFDRLVLYEDVAPVLFRLQQSASCLRIVQLMVEFLGLVQASEGCHADRVLEFEQLRLCTLHQVAAASGLDVGFSADSQWKPRTEIAAFVEEVVRQSAAYFSGWQRSALVCQLLQLQREKHGCRDMQSVPVQVSKEVRKYGKNLLKEMQNRNDLMVWNAYIRNEWALGKTKDAVSMLETALAMFSSTTPRDDHAAMAGLCSLYHTLAEIHFNFSPLELMKSEGRHSAPSQETREKVMSCFQCLLDKTKYIPGKVGQVSAAQVLRSRRKFQGIVASLLEDSSVLTGAAVKHYLVRLVNCFALFELCTAGIDDAVQVFDSVLQTLKSLQGSSNSSSEQKTSSRNLEEDLTLCLISVLRNYMSIEVVPLTKLRARLNSALSHFPDNSLLLRQLLDLEAQTHIAGRLRRYFEAATRDPDSLYPVLFEVLGEMGRHSKIQQAMKTDLHTGLQVQGPVSESISDTGTMHRVRAACERGLQHKVTQHCPLLWRLYLKFEAVFGSRERAKGIFYRSLQSCPWAKVLYLDGAEVFGEEQLQELVDLMTEKELRVQIPMEEVELLLNSEPQNADDVMAEPDTDQNSPAGDLSPSGAIPEDSVR
ncbi:hypothetical protein BaRGS_00020103 [Batillaria attramentaria]|uniref:Protein NRDE2 homolog n=1 Tax=Batillaria attramentaria TaxID=370345 RepID=A0ABD0KPC6_9CAEN